MKYKPYLAIFTIVIHSASSYAAECVSSEEWKNNLKLIQPDELNLVNVSNCGNYISVEMYAEAKHISEFMKRIQEANLGSPAFNTLDGSSMTESNLHIILTK